MACVSLAQVAVAPPNIELLVICEGWNVTQPHQESTEYSLEVTDAERRRFPRLYEPGLDGRLPRRIDARLVDISLSGAGFETRVQLNGETHYRLVLGDPSSQVVERVGRLIWNRMAETNRTKNGEQGAVYRSGLHFEDSSPQSSSELLAYIERCGALEREIAADHKDREVPVASYDFEDHLARERTATRYDLTNDEPLYLEAEYAFVVRSLSLGGVLIETVVSAEVGQTVSIDLDLPGETLRLDGRVVSVARRQGRTRPHFRMALEFVDLDKSHLLSLRRFLDRHLN